MSLIVRSAVEADAAGLVELLNPLIATGRLALKDRVTLEQQRAFIRDFPSNSAFLLAPDAHGRIGGFQIVVIAPGAPLKGLGEIATFVAIDLQRRGIGRALTEAMFGAAQAKGCKRLRALISVDNPTALAFYYAMDFRRAFGGSPQLSVVERSTEAVNLTLEQASVCDILTTIRISGIDENAAIARHGAEALAAAKALLADAFDAPVDWRHASMDEGLAVLANLLAKSYPWLTVKARAGVIGAYRRAWK